MKILQTEDYNLFTRIPGNRYINRAFLNNLALEIQKDNRLPYHPMIVTGEDKNGKHGIADGQHRLTIAEKLKLPIYYVIDPEATILTVRQDNTFVHAWKRQDYLLSYVELLYPEYVQLDAFMKEYKLSLNAAIIIASGRFNRPQKVMEDFNLGKFAFADRGRAENLASFLNELKPYCLNYGVFRREFFQAIDMVYDLIDAKVMLKKLDTYHVKLDRQFSAKEYIRQFEDIYNKGIHEGNTKRLY